MDESQNSLFYAPELLTSDIDSGSARIPAKRKPKHNKRGNAPTKYNGIEWLCRHCDQGFTHRTHLSTHYVGDHNIIGMHGHLPLLILRLTECSSTLGNVFQVFLLCCV